MEITEMTETKSVIRRSTHPLPTKFFDRGIRPALLVLHVVVLTGCLPPQNYNATSPQTYPRSTSPQTYPKPVNTQSYPVFNNTQTYPGTTQQPYPATPPQQNTNFAANKANQVQSKLNYLMQQAQSKGAVVVMQKQGSLYGNGDQTEQLGNLDPSQEYGIVAVCDDNCQQLGLDLYDSQQYKGNKSGITPTFESEKPQYSQPYSAKVTMQSCNTPPCNWGLLVMRKPVQNAYPISNPTAAAGFNLTGLWTSNQYQCPAGQFNTETVKVEQQGQNISALKITGDYCVPAGNMAFEGSLSGNSGSLRCTVGSPQNPASAVIQGTLNIIDANSFQACDMLFVR